MGVKIVEGYWICPNCETKCRGAQQDCNNCGAVRTADVKFFCDSKAPAITDEKEIELAKAGPDWICGFCGDTSPAGAEKCIGCGSPRSEGTKRHTDKKSEDEPLKKEHEIKTKKSPEKPLEPRKPLTKKEKLGCGMLLLLLVILFIVDSFEKPGRIEIKQTFWQRTIEREQLQASRTSDWKDQVPKNAILIATSSEIRRYNSIPDGFEDVEEEYTERVLKGEREIEETVDLGNGRFEVHTRTVPDYEEETRTRQVTRQKYRKEPVYDEKVTYDVLDWEVIDRVMATGTNSLPTWPDSQAITRNPPQQDDIREHKRKEKFWITAVMAGENDEFECSELNSKSMTYEQFLKLKPGTKWNAVFSGLGTLLVINDSDGKPLQ